MTDNRWDPRRVPVTFITDVQQARAELACLPSAADVAVDTETVILRDEEGNIIPRNLDVDGPGPWRVMSIAAKFDSAFGATYRAWVLDMKFINASALWPCFAGVRPWGWNANFDRGVLTRGGLPIRRWYDAMLFDAVLKQGAYYSTGTRAWYSSLAVAAERWLGLSMTGKDDTRLSYDEDTPLTEEQQRYAADDAIITLFSSEALREETDRVGLTQVAYRACNAQAFVHSMTVNGLPLDVQTYQLVLDNAARKAADAAEQVAVLTTGHHVLRTLIRWAATTGILQGNAGELAARADNDLEFVIEVGLPLLHDTDTMTSFLAALREQRTNLEASTAAVLGVEAKDDLFSENKRYELPFGDMSDETKIRRWINKVAPQFVAEHLASCGSTTKGLTKANDMGAVYEALACQPAGVSPEVAKVASYLEAFSRYGKILEQYDAVQGEITLQPDWLLNSADQVKDKLNTYATDLVQAYLERTAKVSRLLSKADSVDDTALKLIGGPLCKALLQHREHTKVLSTYGDNMLEYVHPVTGRIHAKYSMELTGTGRLASSEPNAQNFSPLAKPHMRVLRQLPDGTTVTRDPEGRTRVLVCADLSQAELRFIAHSAQDENMLSAFRSGEDLHERTASLMFSVDLKSLKVYGGLPIGQIGEDVAGLASYAAATPDVAAKDLYKQLRSKAKAVSFGYAYGLKGASLASQLTVQGVPTTREEADELLRKFDIAYPQVAAWMAVRVAFINDLAESLKDQSQPSGVDFEASWQLHRLYAKANSARKVLSNKLGRKPSAMEIAVELVSDEQLRARLSSGNPEADSGPEWDARWEATRTQQAEQVAWALGHYGSAILAQDGTPWSFESRNITGRRRLFQIGTADWVLAMVKLVATSRKAYAKQVTAAWVGAYKAEQEAVAAQLVAAGKKAVAKTIALTKVDPRTKREVPLTSTELEKAMPDKELRNSFVNFVLAEYDKLPSAAVARDYLFRHAMADRVRAAGNQYRNHPIQSGVADAVLEAFSRIDAELTERFPTAAGIQSVHDSIVIECDLKDALAVKELLVRHMEASLSELCPTVPCRADGDVQISLDDHTALDADAIVALQQSEVALAA